MITQADPRPAALDAKALGAELEDLVRSARAAAAPEEYALLESRALRRMQAVGQWLARRSGAGSPGGRDVCERTRLSYFNSFFLDQWRRRMEDGTRWKRPDPEADCVEQAVAFLNGLEAGAHDPRGAGSKRLRLERRTRLKNLWLDPFHAPLKRCPADRLAKVAAHPGLREEWKALLGLAKAPRADRFDAAKGTFLDYVTCRFRFKVRDFVRQERDLVHRPRCGRPGEESAGKGPGEGRWIDDALPMPEELDQERHGSSHRELDRLEARMEVEDILRRLGDKERRFLSPLLTEQAVNLKGLADHWGVTPPAVVKRLRKIRLHLGIAA